MEKHALLSASKAYQWLACTPSIRASEDIPDTTSEYALEGTEAHVFGELNLRLFLGQITKEKYDREVADLEADETMKDYASQYSDFVIERFNRARKKTKDATLEIEVKVDFSQWVPGGFGTADAIIIADGCMEIVDLKYGKGVPVSAENNPQLMLYALGALEDYLMIYDILQVSMTIYQPRLDNISTELIAVEDLVKWGYEYVKPLAEKAFNGEGEFTAGGHCRFCKLKYTCRERANQNLKLAQQDFKEISTLSNDEIADILKISETLASWLNDIKEYALNEALKGVKFRGFKLVEGKSIRKYKNEDEVALILKELGYNDSDIYRKSLLTITAMEKFLGKQRFNDLIGKYIIKPSGKPTLVPENDKRPELNTIAQAIEDFK